MKRGINHNQYHSVLPESAQADLRRAAAEGTEGSAKRAIAIDAAIKRVRQEHPQYFIRAPFQIIDGGQM